MRRAAFLGFTALVVTAISAHAQQAATGPRIGNPDPLGGVTPSQQTQQSTTDEYDPWRPGVRRTPGIQYGNITIFPSVTAGAFYDDNVFATNRNRQHDWAAFVRPELAVQSAGQNYSFDAGAFVEAREYSRFNSENQVNGSATVGGTFMPNPDTQLIGRLRYTHSHEERGGGESLFTQFDDPVGFNLFEASGAINRRFGRFWVSFGAAGSWIDYETPTVGGVPVSQDYRDGTIGVLSARAGYVVAPLTSVFVEVAGNRRDFDVDRFDSDGFRVVGGVLLEPGQGARLKGEAYVGYMYQNYIGANFQEVSTFTYGGALAWIIAPQWTAVAEGRRQALESGLGGGVSLIESYLGARVDYAVMPNFIVGAGATWLNDDFQGVARDDDTISPLVSVKYLASPYITLAFDYRYVNFASNGFGALPYYRNVYFLSLNAKL
jgi:hypothetical protein